MANLKTLLAIFLLFSLNALSAQNFQLDVEGHAKIRGALDINHWEDTTSIFIGRDAGISSVTSDLLQNVFVGTSAGTKNTDGILNVFVGAASGSANISGRWNSFYGQLAGLDSQKGDHNSFFGRASGGKNTVGHRNTFLGAETGLVNFGDSISGSIALGYNAKVNCSQCAVIGGSGDDQVNFGIGVDSPTTVLALLAPGATNPVGITQNKVGGGSSMELTTQDNSGNQSTRLLIAGRDSADIKFFRGAEGQETLTMIIEGKDGQVGIGMANPNDALDVVGDIDATGCIQTDNSNTIGGSCLSDFRLKENISNLNSQLEKILALRPVIYDWKKSSPTRSAENEIGLIAQEVKKVIPEMVAVDDQGYHRIQYDISLQIRMIKALQEQQQEIDALKEQLLELQKTVGK